MKTKLIIEFEHDGDCVATKLKVTGRQPLAAAVLDGLAASDVLDMALHKVSKKFGGRWKTAAESANDELTHRREKPTI